MFNIKFLPARYGDCIWIEYGDPIRPFRILIDGGTGGTHNDIRELASMLPAEQLYVDLCIVTHIDKDHIEGIVRLLDTGELPFGIREIWFNTYWHLFQEDVRPKNIVERLGASLGESLTKFIQTHNLKWNETFFNRAAVFYSEKERNEIMLPGGMKFNILSPSVEQLRRLAPVWEKEATNAGLFPGQEDKVDEHDSKIESFGKSFIPDVEALATVQFEEDTKEPNGSSIAIMAEFMGKRVLFAADAHPSRLLESLRAFQAEGKVHLDLFKVSHHGSAGNTSPDLLEKISCNRFVFSTSGAIFQHPHPSTIARVIKSTQAQKELIFNYRSPFNSVWDNVLLKSNYSYETTYPSQDNDGFVEISLLK